VQEAAVGIELCFFPKQSSNCSYKSPQKLVSLVHQQ